jgi:antitoxin (DNA-binding transcriptional repressor) of toxin-antitoxin stability system
MTRKSSKQRKGNYGVDIGSNIKIEAPSPVTPMSDDGAAHITGVNSYFGSTYLSMDGSSSGDQELIKRYRTLSQYTEVDLAIDNIVNESIVYDTGTFPVSLNLDKLPLAKAVKLAIMDEFAEILKLLKFDEKSYAIFRRWYVDGRIYFNAIVDEKNPQSGILELRPVDALKIKKVKEFTKAKDANGIEYVQSVQEYFLYSESAFVASTAQSNSATNNTVNGIKFNVDAIIEASSGVIDETTKSVLSHLHKAIRPANQLRMLEDAVVIYKIARAPERRIFYIDVGNLPKMKAEEHLRDVMNRYRNKIVYDGVNGEIKDDKKFMSMLEDFWMPRREGGKGTEITTLPGANPSFTDMVDVDYFKTKLYYALNVPLSRLMSQSGFNMGRSSEITRDEVNFMKFVFRLQKRFSFLFLDALKLQLTLKGIINGDEWEFIKERIVVQFEKDNYFEELKYNEILTNRIQTAEALEPYVGKYFSHDFVRKQIFKQTDEIVDEMDATIIAEFDNPIYYPPMAGADDMQDGGTDAGDGEDTGGGSASPTGETGKMTLADVEHKMSKVMNTVIAGKIIQITKKGKVIAKITPANESLNESYDEVRISSIDGLDNLIECMAVGETLTLSENGNTFVNIQKV